MCHPKYRLIFALCALLAFCHAGAAAQTVSSFRPAGEILTTEEVAALGEKERFGAFALDESIKARIRGKSYKSDCTVPFDELRYLRVLHYNFRGEIRSGEMICNRAVANDLLEIFRTLFEARYPIERMVLIDDYGADDERSMQANNSSAFNFRRIAGTNKRSCHSLGLAVDINPLYNPCVKRRTDGTLRISPESGRPYADRSRKFPGKIDTADLCYREFVRHGFEWGGAWKSLKDYQHFEKKPQPQR